MANSDITTIANTTKREVEKAFNVLDAIHTSDAFQKLLDKLWELRPRHERQVFIRDVIHNPGQLEASGISQDGDVSLQRTYFDDNRPTLMALVYHLPEGLGFQKVTITYDDTTRWKGDDGDSIENPFKAPILRYRSPIEDMAGSEHVIGNILALPDDADKKLAAVRNLTPDSFAGIHIPELRVAARWFEHDAPMLDPATLRYISPTVYVDGPPRNPIPPVKPPPGGGGDWTTCVSVGYGLCASVGK